MKVIVIGAGPAGSMAAKELASQGHEVSVFEEHPCVGRPIACTGIVTKALFDFVKKDNYIINELNGVSVVSPKGEQVTVPLHEYVICREKFDTFMMREAVNHGAKYYTNHKFVSLSEKDNIAIFEHKNKKVEIKYDVLVGADGPFSAVGRMSGLTKDRKYYVGSQATVEGDFDPNMFYTFFGSEQAPGFFAWAVPESKHRARVGVATKKFVGKYFDVLRQKFDGNISERQAGPIPIYDGAKNVQKNNVFLVGDAAGLVKNTTGGGIITGIWSAKVLAESIRENKDYSSSLAPLRKELWIHEKLRNMLDCFSDDDYEQLIDVIKTPKIQEILGTHPREFPSKFMWKLAVADPRLALFARYMFA
jgi:geranylgeranyl reductase family protein